MQMPITNPHKLFLIDALGALASTLLLAMVYVLDDFFGMPRPLLLQFMGIASVFFLYSTLMYLVKPTNWKLYLSIIALLNLLYCFYTAFQVKQQTSGLTVYGYLYFVLEMLVILVLSLYELRCVLKTSRQ